LALYTTLASLSQTAASNAADGSVDAPSTIDNQTNLLASFIAQLRDGKGFTTGVGNLGQCRLTKSGANLLLYPYDGNGLTINGVAYAVPSAGVTLAPTALSVGTNYNIYAYMNAGTMTLEASTTAHATDSTTGVEIKSGDATRTLVGKARIITGPAFADTDAQRFVISWFNQKPRRIYNTNGSAPATASTTPVALVSQMEFLTWGEACVPASFVGNVANNTANGGCFTGLGLDSSTALTHSPALMQAYGANAQGSACGGSTFVPAEGYHYIYTLGYVTAGSTGTWAAGIEMSGTIQG
jgi:hypothetical protein